MSDNKENIRIINLNSFFLMLILASGLLICHNTNNNPSDRNKNSAATETSLSQSNATFWSGVQFQAFQKTWISNNNNFKLLSFARNQYLENKIIDQKISPTNSKIGCVTSDNLDLVNEYLRSNRLVENCKFFWGMKSNESLTCLHALKINNAGKPLLVRSDVETIKSSQDKNSQSFKIEIKFNSTSSRVWADATKNNLDKPIAIVIDDKVLYDPVVRTAIENGLCEINGNLSQKEVDYFLALVNNEPLSLNFNLK